MIETKLRRPRLPDAVIEREAVTMKLDRALERPLTIVSAPPGFGKTTLVAQWSESRQIPHAWLSLDAFDNEVHRFWRGVCAALGRIDPRFSERVWQRFGPFEALDPGVGIETLVRELTDYSRSWKAPRAIALILDDFHSITVATVLEQFAYFLDYCPDLLHCLIISRHVPELGLAKRRVRHQLLELGPEDLRFDLASSERFLARRLDLRLSPSHLRVLYQKTEGWVAAIQLAGLSLARDPSRINSLTAFSGQHHFLSDYLLAEVFDCQTPEMRTLLSNIALLPSFSAPLLTEALQSPTVATQLEELVRRNLLVQPLDSHAQWYKLHDLFRDWLRSRGPKPAEAELTCRRAANWLEKQGRAFEAAELLVESEAWNDAAGVLVRSLESWILSGEMFRIEGLVERLPDEVIRTSPGLLFLKAIRSFNFGLYDESSQTLDALDAQLEKGIQLPDFGLAPISTLSGLAHEEALRTLSLFLRSHIASYSGRLQEASMLIRDLALRPELNASSFNAWIHYSIGTHEFVTGRLLAAKDHLSLAMGRAESDGNIFCQILSIAVLVPVLLHRGEFPEAWGWIERMERALGPGWRLHPMAATLPHLRTMLLREENRLDAALQECREALSLGLPQYNLIERTYFCFTCWILALGRGEFEEASDQIEEMRSINLGTLPHWPYVIPEPSTLTVITALAAGRLDPLREWARRALPGQPDDPGLRVSAERLLWCRGRFLMGQDPMEALMAVRQWTHENGVMQRELQTWLAEATVHLFRNDMAAMQRAMAGALMLSAKGGFTRTVLEEGPHVGRMLQACLGHPQVQGEARRLLDELGMPQSGVKEPQAGHIEALSGREQELLGLLDAGLSNQAIADSLGISASTVKAHLRNIYGKLNARNRAQALSVARKHNLLNSSS